MAMRTYFDKTTGKYIGSWNYPPTREQTTHPELDGHSWKDGSIGNAEYRLDAQTKELIRTPQPPRLPSFEERLRACEKALGL